MVDLRAHVGYIEDTLNIITKMLVKSVVHVDHI